MDNVFRSYETLAEDRGLQATRAALCSLAIAGVLALAAFAGLISRSIVCAIATPLCLVAGLVVYANALEEKRRVDVRESVPRALESMSACFASGYTLLQTLRQASQDVEGPLGALFARAVHVLEAGGGAHDALAVIQKDALAHEMAFVAVALDVQHQAGGSVRQVLDAAADTVKGEIELKRMLKVQTAQAKLSARIVSLMPVVLISLFSFMSPDFLSPFFSSVLGVAMLVLALAMQAAGILLVRRELSIGGEL